MTKFTRFPPKSDPPLSPRDTLPTMYDLPSENPEEPGLPDEYHCYQPALLRQTFKPSNYEESQIFIGTDINLYYDVRHVNWYKRPDWFAVMGIERLYENQDLRLSYVIWQEQVSPFVAVELLSPGTENEDLGRTVRQLGKPPTKWEVYEKILKIPYYIVFSRYTNELQIFQLMGGEYQRRQLINGRFPLPELGLSLGLWQGSYENINRLWLRWFTLEGELILNSLELVEIAKQKTQLAEQKTQLAEQKTQLAEQKAQIAEQKAARLAAKLRELNIDPDNI